MHSDLSLPSQTLKEFEQMARRYAFFHAAFFVVFIVELAALLVFMLFFAKTMGAAVIVAAAFLTVFVYFVLRFYLQTRKQEMLILLRDRFMAAVGGATQNADRNRAAEKVYPIYQLIQKLQGKEFFSTGSFFALRPFAPLIEKFHLWCWWDDLHWMKETLHHHALRKILDCIKLYPTDLELHKSLAGAYTALYQIYREPSSGVSYSFIVRRYEAQNMKGSFEKACRSALEELKVVLAYLPEDTWALTQIAHVYRDLGQKEKEKTTYETLLNIRPDDTEIHYQLGKLYFELGLIAEGLELYHQLQEQQDPKAKELIRHYDAYHNADLSF